MTHTGGIGTEFVLVGKAGRPHGLKGELRVFLNADSPFFLDQLSRLHFAPQGRPPNPTGRRIRSWRRHKQAVLLIVDGVADRNMAAELTNHDIYALAADLPPLDPNEYYLHQILGLDVTLEDGSALGRITDILTPTPEQEIWVITTPRNREILLPAHDESVLSIDLEQNAAVVAPPEGLLDLYLK